MCRGLKRGKAAPPVVVRKEKAVPSGELTGSTATQPDEVNNIIRGTHGNILRGNTADGKQLAEAYMEEHCRYVLRMEKAEIEELTGNELLQSAREANDSVAGLDQSTMRDLSMLTKKHVALWQSSSASLRRRYNWPDQLRQTRTALLASERPGRSTKCSATEDLDDATSCL